MSVEVYDNFLPQDLYNNVSKFILGENMPWFFSNGTVYDGDGCPQFSHTFYLNCEPVSPHWSEIRPVLVGINPLGLHRIKVNATTRTTDIVEKPLHYDVTTPDETIPEDVKICIIYFNDCDGYTYFEDGQKVQSKANRAIKFPGTYKHAGSSCTDADRRIVCNIVYL